MKTLHNEVEHPAHYANGDIECIDAIREQLGDVGFIAYCQGNIVKYLWRWKAKGGLQDLKKAQVYLDWMIEEVELDEQVKTDEAEESGAASAKLATAEQIACQLVKFSYDFDYYNWCDNDPDGELEIITQNFLNGVLIDSYIDSLNEYIYEGRDGAKEAQALINNIVRYESVFFCKEAAHAKC